MKTFEAIEMIKTIALNQLPVVPLMVSGPGMGKTSLVHQAIDQLAKETGNKWGIKVVHLSAYDAPDVQGFGIPGKDREGNAIMHFTRPEFMPGPDDPEHGIVFLDEFGQAGQDVQKPVARFVNERKIGSHTLKPGWMIAMASNREQDRSGVNRMLAMMTNRVTTVEIEPNLKAWVQWAECNDVNPIITAFAEFKPGLVFSDTVPDTPGPFTTPRTLCLAGYVLENYDNEDIATQMVMGYMGRGAGAELMAFVRMASELPKFDAIIANPQDTPVPTKPDASFAVSRMIASRVDADTIIPAFKYLVRMPKEFQVSALHAALNRDSSLASNKEFSDWIAANSSLVFSSYS